METSYTCRSNNGAIHRSVAGNTASSSDYKTISRSGWVEIETVEMVAAIQDLRQSLMCVDLNLLDSNIPFTVSDDLEQHFSDMAYYVSRYLLLLDELAFQQGRGAKLQ